MGVSQTGHWMLNFARTMAPVNLVTVTFSDEKLNIASSDKGTQNTGRYGRDDECEIERESSRCSKPG